MPFCVQVFYFNSEKIKYVIIINHFKIYIYLVYTLTGAQCQFPFTYNNQIYKTCIVGGPSNSQRMPQCMIDANTWDYCSGI